MKYFHQMELDTYLIALIVFPSLLGVVHTTVNKNKEREKKH